MTRVLVTGGTGFVGRQALPLLAARGDEVHATWSSAPGDERGGVTWHRCDLLDRAAAAALVESLRPTHLLHLAWYAVPGKFWDAEENAAWVAASLALLSSFAEAGGRRATFAGSCAEYEWADGVLSEASTPLAPATYYGKCKNALREVAEGFAARRDVGFAWGRIFFVYGPHEHPDRLVSSLARALVRGEPAPTSEGSQRRDFLHARDVAGAFAALLGSDVQGAVNIGSGEAVPVRDVVSAVADAAGRPDLVQWGALPQRPGDPPLLEADVRRLRDEVGWRPGIPLAEGIARTVEWWKAQQ
ncbi:MAG TPA: NAD(P)-dependent oxidoreductase [Solirubrobacterales bacterium]|nr:NAD(P)-dependent oxidoreductase [Solirubrobacterales bacterium]